MEGLTKEQAKWAIETQLEEQLDQKLLEKLITIQNAQKKITESKNWDELTEEEIEKHWNLEKESVRILTIYQNCKINYEEESESSENESEIDSESENELQSETLAENSQQVQTKSKETINISESLELILKEHSNQQISVSSNQNLSEICKWCLPAKKINK